MVRSFSDHVFLWDVFALFKLYLYLAGILRTTNESEGENKMESIIGFDTALIFWIQNHLVTGALSPLMIGLSTMGNVGAVWIVIGLGLLCSKKYRRAGIAVFIGLAFSLLVGNGILKHLAMRVRPCIDYPWMPMLVQAPPASDFSFPSGHTFGSFAAAAALFRGVKRKWGFAALGLAAGIGFSRIYLFMHYPSDVFTGAALGIFFGGTAWYLAGKLISWGRVKNYYMTKGKTELQ